jgi:hypothetical protein
MMLPPQSAQSPLKLRLGLGSIQGKLARGLRLENSEQNPSPLCPARGYHQEANEKGRCRLGLEPAGYSKGTI